MYRDFCERSEQKFFQFFLLVFTKQATFFAKFSGNPETHVFSFSQRISCHKLLLGLHQGHHGKSWNFLFNHGKISGKNVGTL